MGKKLYVGNLAFSIDGEALKAAFSECGNVVSASVITERDSGRSKGFGFVEMSTEEEAMAAVSALNGRELNGRAIRVSEARPQAEGGGRGNGGGGGRRPMGGGGHGGGFRGGPRH